MDNIYRVERTLADGETAVESQGSYPGGSAANTVYGLARLGISTGFCGAVGDDRAGRLLVRGFVRVKTDISQIRVKPKVASGTTFCLSDGHRRSIYVMAGANSLLTPNDIDMSYINQARYLHLSSFVDKRQFELTLGVVSQLGPQVRLSFSPGALYAARGLQALTLILKKTHILFINRGEIERLTDKRYEVGARACLELGCKIVAVTLGKGIRDKGALMVAYIRDGQNEYRIGQGRGKRTEVADTTGAGDAFAAGFLYGLLGDKSLTMCGQLGHATARFSLKCPGARQGLPTRRQLKSYHHRLYSI